MSAVWPWRSCTVVSAPASNSTSTILAWPPWAASIRGVSRLWFIRFTLAWNCSSRRHITSLPARAAAMSAVSPVARLMAFTGAPALSMASRQASCPCPTHFVSAESPSWSAMDTLAVAQSKARTTSPCPSSAASMRPVQPRKSSMSTEAPDCSSKRTTSAWPRWHARCSAVLPCSLSAGALLAPQFTSIRATSAWPEEAAIISGVTPRTA
mmetsp:Transcript_80912/g.262041  ORF Transcript_80912/g.262041 Transcript_80912/m.262041 type:complete len:210 (+) Transcript_80912:318-947(+)